MVIIFITKTLLVVMIILLAILLLRYHYGALGTALSFAGGSASLGNSFFSYSPQSGYSNLDLRLPFNSNFIFSPPSQATGYWTLNSPVYVYIFYQANPIFYTASNVTNPYGPDEDDQ